jgi:hypothetical protein
LSVLRIALWWCIIHHFHSFNTTRTSACYSTTTGRALAADLVVSKASVHLLMTYYLQIEAAGIASLAASACISTRHHC